MLANRGANVSFSFNATRAIIEFHENNVYGHLEQVSRTCVYFHFTESEHNNELTQR